MGLVLEKVPPLLVIGAVLVVALGPPPASAEVTVTVDDDVPYDLQRPSPMRTVDVYYQERAPAQARPALVMVHGGGWSSGSKEDLAPRAQNFALADRWAVFSVGYDYNAGDRWESLPADMEAFLAWLAGPGAATYHVDVSRVGLVGISSGAHLAMLAGFRGDRLPPGMSIAAVSSWVGPTDLVDMAGPCADQACSRSISGPWYTQQFTGNCPQDSCTTQEVQPCFVTAEPACPEHYTDNSPLLHVDGSDPPTQMFASTLDPIVPFSQATDLEEALESAGVIRDCIRSDDRTHSVPPAAQSATRAFMRFHLLGSGTFLQRECLPG